MVINAPNAVHAALAYLLSAHTNGETSEIYIVYSTAPDVQRANSPGRC